jgi:hypothetical protein
VAATSKRLLGLDYSTINPRSVILRSGSLHLIFIRVGVSAVRDPRRGDVTRTPRDGGFDDVTCYTAWNHATDCVAPPLAVEVPCDHLALRRTRRLYFVSNTSIRFRAKFRLISRSYSTKLDAEKRLALQEEKQALETKLLEVSVVAMIPRSHPSDHP